METEADRDQSVHPGLMRTELQRNMGIIGPAIMVRLAFLNECTILMKLSRNSSSKDPYTVPTPSCTPDSRPSSKRNTTADM